MIQSSGDKNKRKKEIRSTDFDITQEHVRLSQKKCFHFIFSVSVRKKTDIWKEIGIFNESAKCNENRLLGKFKIHQICFSVVFTWLGVYVQYEYFDRCFSISKSSQNINVQFELNDSNKHIQRSYKLNVFRIWFWIIRQK